MGSAQRSSAGDCEHDTLARRLALILIRLNQGHSIHPREIAAEFGVNLRTVQRDLNQRFDYLPLERVDGRYRLNPAFFGRLGVTDIERFAAMAGVRGLFPALSSEFLRDIFDSRVRPSFLVRGHHYEDLSHKAGLFAELERAIAGRRNVSFRYARQSMAKQHDAVAPYKLLNHHGIWYLVGVESGKLKTFSVSKVDALLVLDGACTTDPAMQARIEEDEGIWLGSERIDCVLEVSPAVAEYFRRRPVLVGQAMMQEREDGFLVVSAQVGHANEVLPQVRYWLPHVRIVSPDYLRLELEKELATYLTASAKNAKVVMATNELQNRATVSRRDCGEP